MYSTHLLTRLATCAWQSSAHDSSWHHCVEQAGCFNNSVAGWDKSTQRKGDSMVPNYAGLLALGGLCCAGQAFLIGAASLCLFWGPVVGASIVTYRTALLAEVVSQLIGNIAFGPLYLSPYDSVLKSAELSSIVNSPELVLYSLFCVAVVLLAWHVAAVWHRVPVSPASGLALGLAGTTLIFPGPRSTDWGSQTDGKPPFLSGLGSVSLGWVSTPVVSLVCGGIFMLSFRHVLRKEEPFYEIVWRLPAISYGVNVVLVAYVLYALSTPNGVRINTLTPQGAIVVMIAWGMAVCIYTCLFAPCSIRRFGYIRQPVQIRRMNLLGLPADVVRDVAASSAKDTGWLRGTWNSFMEQDIFVNISQSDKLIRIHASSEQYDANTEGLFCQMAIFMCGMLSIGQAGNSFSAAGGLFAAMLNIYTTGRVSETFQVPIYLRCIAAVCTALGAILAGGRLMPVLGVQICKMTPVRACVIMYATAIAAIAGRTLSFDVPYIYLCLPAVVIVGVVDGVSHVNLSLIRKILAWWVLGALLVFLISAFLTWQGTTAPSVSLWTQVQGNNTQIKASNSVLRGALGQTFSPEEDEVADLQTLQNRVSQLAALYAAAVSSCANMTV